MRNNKRLILACAAVTLMVAYLAFAAISLRHETSQENNFVDEAPAVNPLFGHIEKDTVIGNFTGMGTDTLFVEYVHRENPQAPLQFYLCSSNKQIPSIRIHGSGLVMEGDLDRNGTDEVGYLDCADGRMLQRYYILTLRNGSWCYLINPARGETSYGFGFLDTNDIMRSSGREIASPAGKKGYVKIAYSTWRTDNFNVHDTILKADYTKVDTTIWE